MDNSHVYDNHVCYTHKDCLLYLSNIKPELWSFQTTNKPRKTSNPNIDPSE